MRDPRKPRMRTVYFRADRDAEKPQLPIEPLPEKVVRKFLETDEQAIVEPVRGEIEFRMLKSSEVDAAAAFVRGAFVMFVAPSLKPAGRAEFYKYITPEQFRMRLSDNYAYVAVCDGEIIGLVNVRDYCHISLLFVALHFQKLGLGRSLLDAVERRARKKGCARLTAHASPNSVPAYERLGFKKLGKEKKENEIRFFEMEKELE